MGPDGKPILASKSDQQRTDNWQQWMQPSPTQKAWARRIQAGRMTSEDKATRID